jgi:hypothetical protein
MPKTFHHAFSIEYPSHAIELFTDIEAFSPKDEKYKSGIKTFAIWDTGATMSSISPNLAKSLRLTSVDSLVIDGINSSEDCDIVMVSIKLPNDIIIPDLRVAVCDFNPSAVDVLVGMDIIRMGDFMVSNGKDKTLFSFAIPPLPMKINLVNQADNINKQ